MRFFCCCFFFKQKTAYEMRISDWSSDVCSSDLIQAILAQMFDHHQFVLLGMALPSDRLGAPDGGLPILLIEAQRLWHEAFPAEVRDRFGLHFDFGLRARRQTLKIGRAHV